MSIELIAEKYELTTTRFAHPDIVSGQHTNGPSWVWVREIGGHWIPTKCSHRHRVVAELETRGINHIIKGTWLEK